MSGKKVTAVELAKLVSRNTTEAQHEILVGMGFVKADGTLNIEPSLKLKTSAEVPAPTQVSQARLGIVFADGNNERVAIKVFKNSAGQVWCDSNIVQKNGVDENGKPKNWTTYIPAFKDVSYQQAWKALKTILPEYLVLNGNI